MCKYELRELLIELGIFVLFMIPSALLLIWFYFLNTNCDEQEDLSQLSVIYQSYALDKEKTNYEVFHPKLKSDLKIE